VTCFVAGCAGAARSAPPVPEAALPSEAPSRTQARIDRILASVTDPVLVHGEPLRQTSVSVRMAEYRVPAVSVAVVEGGRLAWARALGVADASTGKAATPATMFQAASISKAIAATLTLRLVQQGALELDADVNRYLTSWRVPDTPYTREEKVTLRRLMAHRAGATVHGFLSIPEGERPPSIVEMLQGAGLPGYEESVHIDTVPGTVTRYSGGGVLIEQLVAMDVMHDSYVDLARRLVFEPFGMTDSSFEQPLPPARRAAAASAHDSAGHVYPGNFLVLPAQAAGGLWTTPSDLVRWASLIAQTASGDSSRLLVPALATTMTQRLALDDPVALGTFVWGEGKGRYFWHGGHNEGYLSELIYFPETGQGAAVMTNGDAGANLLRSILHAIATEYAWVDYGPASVDRAQTDRTLLDRLVGTYRATKPTSIDLRIDRQGSDLFIQSSKFGIRSRGVLTAAGEITTLSQVLTMSFAPGEAGEVNSLQIGSIQLTRQKSEAVAANRFSLVRTEGRALLRRRAGQMPGAAAIGP
jgi:CubicO group peptidase (beta-lactamase class C family)